MISTQRQSTNFVAEHDAAIPLLDPLQVQAQGPLPVTLEAVPAVHKFVVGAEGKLAPFDEPQAPLTALLAEQLLVVCIPPFAPAQVQVQGPEPDTEDAVPALQRSADGAE
ncbi:MAG: hypothetical protein WC408_04050 [Candidatus Micrarchaeia archaeon]